jgi:putative membrane protein
LRGRTLAVWIFKFLILLTVVALGAGLAALNAEPVRFDYYFAVVRLPLSLILVGALAIGALLGVLAGLSVALEVRRENARLRRKARVTEQEITNLRTLPLQDR